MIQNKSLDLEMSICRFSHGLRFLIGLTDCHCTMCLMKSLAYSSILLPLLLKTFSFRTAAFRNIKMAKCPVTKNGYAGKKTPSKACNCFPQKYFPTIWVSVTQGFSEPEFVSSISPQCIFLKWSNPFLNFCKLLESTVSVSKSELNFTVWTELWLM